MRQERSSRLNNVAMAESYIKQAEERLHHASEALQRNSYPYVIRQSQEVVELSLSCFASGRN